MGKPEGVRFYGIRVDRSVLVTWISGSVGLVAGGLAGWFFAGAYVERHVSSSEGFEAMGTGMALIVILGCLSTVVAVWASLQVAGCARPGITSGLFLLCMSILIPAGSGVGAILLPVNIGIEVGGILTLLLAGFVSAVLARTGAKSLERLP